MAQAGRAESYAGGSVLFSAFCRYVPAELHELQKPQLHTRMSMGSIRSDGDC